MRERSDPTPASSLLLLLFLTLSISLKSLLAPRPQFLLSIGDILSTPYCRQKMDKVGVGFRVKVEMCSFIVQVIIL
jgi:hypothetical protein